MDKSTQKNPFHEEFIRHYKMLPCRFYYIKDNKKTRNPCFIYGLKKLARNSPSQLFSNFNMHQNHLEAGSLSPPPPAPAQSFQFGRSVVVPKNLYFLQIQVMLMLLVQV